MIHACHSLPRRMAVSERVMNSGGCDVGSRGLEKRLKDVGNLVRRYLHQQHQHYYNTSRNVIHVDIAFAGIPQGILYIVMLFLIVRCHIIKAAINPDTEVNAVLHVLIDLRVGYHGDVSGVGVF